QHGGGNFKNKAGLGDGGMLSTPTVITGDDYNLHSLADTPGLELRLLFENRSITITLQFTAEYFPAAPINQFLLAGDPKIVETGSQIFLTSPSSSKVTQAKSTFCSSWRAFRTTSHAGSATRSTLPRS